MLFRSDQIKAIASQLGWNGAKDSKSRQFLSDLKDLSTNYNDGPFLYILGQILKDQNILFVHIREIEEIEKLKNWVQDMNANRSVNDPQILSFKSIKLVRPFVKSLSNNTGDLGSQKDYAYDEFIMNDGTLEELRLKAIRFVSDVCDSHQRI